MKRRQYLFLVVLTVALVVGLSAQIVPTDSRFVNVQEGNQPPFVSNVRVSQRAGTKLVDIIYDVDDPDGDLLTITVEVSDDGGSTFTVPASSFTGDVGSGVVPGVDRHIVWDAEVYSANYQVRITASDEHIGKDGAKMVLIPAGEFSMGDHHDVGYTYEKPVHTVYLDAFYMDVYEVTNALYKKFMDATGHKAPGYWNDSKYNAPDQPVVGVSWEDAKAYADWAGKRLPTEAEWEKAARGGLSGKKFPWGGDAPDGTQCNFADKNVDDGYGYAAPVGSYPPNDYGLYDMAGNVWEWCSDWYDSNYYTSSPKRNPTGPSSRSWRFLRGGSWAHNVYYLRCANRSGFNPSLTDYSLGFRCSE